MNKLQVELEHCYGIKKLNHKFDFSSYKTFVIYAPNGVMKTCFAKTFDDYIMGKDSRDKVFDRKPYLRMFLDENGSEIINKDIFVIKSFVDTNYTSDKLSTLLVRNELRLQYQEILEFLNNSKNELVKILAENTKSTECEKEIVKTFPNLGDNFIDILNNLFPDISSTKIRDYDFKYNHVFENDVVKRFLEKNRDNIKLYYDKYFEILSNSDDFFTSDGSFGTAQANGILESVEGDSFFNAGHKIILKNKTQINSSKELKNTIDSQIKKIISNPELETQFKKIDKALQPKNIQPFKEIISKDKELLLELIDYDEFQKSYWKSHLSKMIDKVTTLKDLHIKKKKEIEKIFQEAHKESDAWETTIKTFKERFVGIPIKVGVKNTKDSVLGLDKPELNFSFVDLDTGDQKEVERDFLSKDILSQGEKRAFYLLNIIFEINARILEKDKTLFIIDDIADSFDYKNKYAIVEYLKDLTKEANFCSIILTHNFDFFRTINSRVLYGKFKETHSLIAEKLKDEIKLISEKDKNIINPFNSWRKDVNNNEKYLIACIPFVRNLIDYKDGGKDYYKFLTHALHIKEQDGTIKATTDITIADLEGPFSSVLSNIRFVFPDPSKKIINVIEEQIRAIKDAVKSDSIVLEDKIILSIGIRLIAEEYMWSKVTDRKVISGCQTGILFERYKREFKQDQAQDAVIKTLESVVIMTPENIHLNSFMYEPILDMGIDELKKLYDKVCNLSSK
jgi:hypothetical protein